MFVEKHLPKTLSGEELDVYLEQGWYRMGQSVFTCHFLFFDDSLFSPIWLRLPLQGYRFRKSLRKIKKKVEERFEVEVRPAVVDEEKEMLFQQYKKHFKGKPFGSVNEALFEGSKRNIFNTWEVAVYDEGRLIAFSLFDLGHLALASIKAVYAYEYRNFSLGIYTMIREIQHGCDNGFDYYYPGYFVPDYPRFDYKLRMGKPEEVQYFDLKTSTWLPYSSFSQDKVPVYVMNMKLFRVGFELSALRISFQLLYYPSLESSHFGPTEQSFLQSPLFLHVFSDYFLMPRFAIFYDLRDEEYVFSHCLSRQVLEAYLGNSGLSETDKKLVEFMLKHTVIITSASEAAIIDMVKKVSNLLQHVKAQRSTKH